MSTGRERRRGSARTRRQISVPSHPPADLGTLQVRQHEIEDEEVGTTPLEPLHGLSARERRVGLIAGLAEVETDQIHQIRLVIDDQNTFRHPERKVTTS
jgi:hypothetical protein